MMLERLAAAFAAATVSTMAAAALAGAMALTLPAARTGSSVPETSGEASAPVELAHGCHRNIQRDYSGWHFHSGACVRRNTAPPGLHDYYANRRYYRGPLCSYQCKYVGPVKTCSQVCR